MGRWSGTRTPRAAVRACATRASVLLACVVLAFGACGALVACSSATRSVPGTVPISAAPDSGTSAPAGTPSGAPVGTPSGAVRTITDAATGSTVTVQVGARFRVVLASTYWRFTPLAAGGAAQAEGKSTFLPGKDCVPGGGCGTITQEYLAVAPGTVSIQASRTSCGEARLCSPTEGSYAVTVVVVG